MHLMALRPPYRTALHQQIILDEKETMIKQVKHITRTK